MNWNVFKLVSHWLNTTHNANTETEPNRELYDEMNKDSGIITPVLLGVHIANTIIRCVLFRCLILLLQFSCLSLPLHTLFIALQHKWITIEFNYFEKCLWLARKKNCTVILQSTVYWNRITYFPHSRITCLDNFKSSCSSIPK